MMSDTKISKLFFLFIFILLSENYIYGMVEKSKPQTDYPFTYPFAYNLKCDDIDGCLVGTKNRINKFQSPYEYNLNIKDIKGTQSGSLKKGIVTERNLNPLHPKYKFLGQQELGTKFENDPYGKNLKKDKAEAENKDTKSQLARSVDVGISGNTKQTKLSQNEKEIVKTPIIENISNPNTFINNKNNAQSGRNTGLNANNMNFANNSNSNYPTQKLIQNNERESMTPQNQYSSNFHMHK